MFRRLFGPSKSPPGDVIGGGRNRDGSSNDCTFVCFLTGVRLGEDLRLLENAFRVFALLKENKQVASKLTY